MNPTTVGIVGIAIMILIFFSRMPVAYVMTLIGFLGFSFMISVKGGSTFFPETFMRFSPLMGLLRFRFLF